MTKDDLKGDLENIEIAALPVAGSVATEKADALHSAEPPDGGTRAWLQVAGCILMFFNVWYEWESAAHPELRLIATFRGFTFAFGSFSSYYELTYIPKTSPSAIQWIGSIQSSLLITMGVITGQLFDRGYFKSLVLTGAVLSTFAVMMLSLSTTFWQILLSQGVCIGLGSGMVFTPSTALVARSFKKHRAIAMGVVAVGAPTG